MKTVRQFRLEGELPFNTRGEYGERITGAHTDEDGDNPVLFVFDSGFGDQVLGRRRALETNQGVSFIEIAPAIYDDEGYPVEI